jgi:hypothetical protein
MATGHSRHRSTMNFWLTKKKEKEKEKAPHLARAQRVLQTGIQYPTRKPGQTRCPQDEALPQQREALFLGLSLLQVLLAYRDRSERLTERTR